MPLVCKYTTPHDVYNITSTLRHIRPKKKNLVLRAMVLKTLGRVGLYFLVFFIKN